MEIQKYLNYSVTHWLIGTYLIGAPNAKLRRQRAGRHRLIDHYFFLSKTSSISPYSLASAARIQ
jgi:hypothetical protein